MARILSGWLVATMLAVAIAGARGQSQAPTAATVARQVAPLIDPAKLMTLKTARAANPRVQKYVALLAKGKHAGLDVEQVATEATALAGMKGAAAKLTAVAMVRNVTIAERLGCLDAEGLADMRKGQAATIRRGPYRGDQLSVDHIIPRAVVPELDKVIANLELMPLRMNEGKNDVVGERQVSLARELHHARLLAKAGLKAVEAAGKERR